MSGVLLALAALQAALAQPAAVPARLTVASPRGSASVPVVNDRGYPAVATAQLGQALTLQTAPARASGGVVLRVLGRQYDFVLDAPYFRSEGRRYAMVGALYVARDSVFVPLQWAVELLPRLDPRVRYDAASARLEEPGDAPAIVVRGDTARASAPAVPPAAAPGRRRHVVAIDAGHGGVDVGMMGPIGQRPFLREKDVTLAVARELKRELERRGFGTVMTRDADTLIALGDRGRIAGEKGAQLFVSVHVNAANPGWRHAAAQRGFETYFLAEARTEDARRVERMENSSVRFETRADAARGDPLRFILRDLAQNEHLRESSRVAALVESALDKVHPAEARGVKQAGFMVLATSYMPAVLVEVGYGSNPSDARWLVSAEGQRALARAIADGVERYFAGYDRRVGADE